MAERPLTGSDIARALDQLGNPGDGSGRRSSQETHEFFGSYQVIDLIGEGGAAKVLRVRHIHPNYAERTYALKLLHQANDAANRGLFRKEAYLMAQLRHPNIVRTFEAGVEDDKLFIVMEYISGKDLWDLVDRANRLRTRLPDWMVLHLLGEVLRGLIFAHELTDPDGRPLQVIHHDVNPTNVFLSFDGEVKLGDFGVAAITGTGDQQESQGKVGYFAPEQFTDAPLDQRVDVFSFGVMMFELLCGQSPFDAKDPDEVLRLNSQAIVPAPSKLNPGMSPELEKIILRALKRRPKDRFATAAEMMAALEPHLPPPDGMRVAVAAQIRTLMLHEYVKELQLRRGLSGGDKDDRVGNSIAVLSPRREVRQKWHELLVGRRFRVTELDSVSELEPCLLGTTRPPDALVVDVGSEAVGVEEITALLNRSNRLVPVVAFAPRLSPAAAARAQHLGASDIIFNPLAPDRVQTALWVAVMSARTPQTNGAASTTETKPTTRIALVTRDAELAERLPVDLAQWGYEVEVMSGTQEVLARSAVVTFQAAVYDVPGEVDDDARGFAERFRAELGMGLVPVVFLTVSDEANILAGIPRGAVRARDDAPVTLAQTLGRLRSDVRSGRSFIRYAAHFTVEMRFSGRSFAAEAADVSRGGIMLRCHEIPPVGTRVQLFLALPQQAAAVEVPGRVVRILLPSPDEERSGVGIEFGGFGAQSEAPLIEFLRRLSAEASARR